MKLSIISRIFFAFAVFIFSTVIGAAQNAEKTTSDNAITGTQKRLSVVQPLKADNAQKSEINSVENIPAETIALPRLRTAQDLKKTEDFSRQNADSKNEQPSFKNKKLQVVTPINE
jgi:hypothetical protein